MNYLTDSNIFRQHQAIIESLVIRDRRLPEQVLKKPLSHFTFIDADGILLRSFFERIKSFLSKIGGKRCYLMVIEPDPVSYFFENFRKYPVIEMSIDDTADEYLRIIQEDPGDSPADAVAYNGRILLLYSDSAKWIVYADRDLGLAVIGVVEESLKKLFASSYGPEQVFTAEEAIYQLLEVVYVNTDTGVPLDTRNQLIANYS